jgi:hypothetical protein
LAAVSWIHFFNGNSIKIIDRIIDSHFTYGNYLVTDFIEKLNYPLEGVYPFFFLLIFVGGVAFHS